ncbi:MAG: SIMPL domain-containing protein [Candidatus Binatia bacterium]|nr:SIMPL domain-containing protein [Candidatus Binatia bacterium]MDG1959807.1 SIMPL domain-containing protein [Candidatus Binatia bacterium]
MVKSSFRHLSGWLMGAFLFAGCGTAVTNTGGSEPSIQTRGEAVISVAPDRAFITLAIEARDPRPNAAQTAVAKASRTAMQALEGARLGDDALQTLSYSLQEEYDWQDRKRTLRGYVARNTIEVRIDEVARVGEVLGLAVSTGVTSVSGLRFDTSKRADLEQQALTQAVAQARAYATAAAAGAGIGLGEVIEIQQEGGGSPAPRIAYSRSMAAEAKTGAPPIESGDIEIRASARIRVAISAD